ncbi:MAG: hypothetical protein P1S46_10905 [bacterium]|nr:hypothetical protein [bacterium]MDT8396070.1 hypothetical protein [bacterium]
MKKAMIVAVALVLTVGATAEARTKLVALPDREAVTVRLDNPQATLVEEERVLTLQEGENLVDFSWRGVQIDPDSIRLAIMSHPGKVTLLSVSYPPGEAALVWRIHSGGAWEEKVRISYLLSYIDRLVTYKGVASKDEKNLDLQAFLVLRNFSGEDFTDAAINLGQGEPFNSPSSHEETRQVHFLSAEDVPVKKTFTWDAAQKPWEPKRLDTDVGIPVHYVIENSVKSGLGRDLLWDGKVRVFQDDGRGSTIFLGEDRVGLTPVGEEMRIYIGDSRDVSVTQLKVMNNTINPRPSRYTVVLYDTEEKIETELENFKDEAVIVDLVQHIPGEWEMKNSSLEYEKKDANTIVYHVRVPAKGKEKMSFHYNRRNVRR